MMWLHGLLAAPAICRGLYPWPRLFLSSLAFFVRSGNAVKLLDRSILDKRYTTSAGVRLMCLSRLVGLGSEFIL